jgi:hypothetical protein
MRDVDRAAIAIGLSLTRMMENAGAGLAWLACALLGGDVAGRRITLLAGPGGNGGGGLVAARRLIGWGAEVAVRRAATPDEFAPVRASSSGCPSKRTHRWSSGRVLSRGPSCSWTRSWATASRATRAATPPS